jgi:mannosyl-oligosaccharide alpha-1,2-mannosidase
MSFAIPRNLPNFDAQQRQLEDRVWGSSGRSRHTHGGSNGGASAFSFGGIGKELPMYKDKPYNYPASKRRRSLKIWAVVIVILISTWYFFFGRFGSTAPKVLSGSTSWSKFSSSKKESKTWSARRLQVVEAMKISWSGYEKHAWGSFNSG